MEALCLWQKQYADKPKFAISRFINYLVNNYNLASRRVELQTAMARLLMAPADSLDTDPMPMMQEYAAKYGLSCDEAKGDATAAPLETTENRLFRLLIAELEHQLMIQDTVMVTRMVETLKWQLFRLDLPVVETKRIELWLNNRSQPLQVSIALKKLHALVNAVYILLCKQLGPVESDQLFGLAVSAVEQSAEAAGGSPRILL